MLTAEDLTGLRPGTADELAAIKNDDWRDAVELGELRVHEGDLTLDDGLDAADLTLLVRGDLIVAGTVVVGETGTLVVTGRLRCQNLACEGNLEIQGDVAVAETIFGYYEAGITFFHGAVTAALFIHGNHGFEYDADRMRVGTELGFINFRGFTTGTEAQARAALSARAFAVLAPLIGLVAEGPSSQEAGRLLRTEGFLPS